MKAVFDTNILIDYLNGISQAKIEMQHYQDLLISPITWIEVMVGASDPAEENIIRSFLNQFQQIPIASPILELSVKIKKEYKIRLPDAIIWATAQSQNALLVTRNIKDFPIASPSVRVPYQI